MPRDKLQADQTPTTRDTLSQTLVGSVIGGDFEIRQEIGRGGMGTVFEAWQRSLQRIVAVKVLTAPIGLTPTSVQRFQREAQAAGKLHHTNIVPIYAQSEHEGIYYYAMELVHGRSVHQIIAQARGEQDASGLGNTETLVVAGSGDAGGQDGSGRGSSAQAASQAGADRSTVVQSRTPSQSTVDHFDSIARLTATVAEALEYAHQAGVIHRDIKPHNLILGDDGRLCITDFGLARVVEQPGMTMTGEFMGSPLYMSPEQIGGGRVDHRTDVYSLGATLYEWMTLSPPFPGDTRELVISQITMAEPQRPRSLNTEVPLDLETICLKAIAKDPKDRYQRAGGMAADLRRYLERSAIKARRTGAATRMVKYVQRHPVGALVAVLVLVSLLFGGAWWKQRDRSRGADVARQDAEARASQAILETEELTESRNALMDGLKGLAELDSAEQQEQGLAGVGQALDDLGAVGKALGLTSPGSAKLPTDALAEQMGAFSAEVPRRFATDLHFAHLQAERDRLEAADPTASLQPGEPEYLQALLATEDQDALDLLDQALSIDAGRHDARYLRAVVLCRLARFKELQEDAGRLLRVPEQSPVVFLLRGMARLFLGEPDPALQDVEQCLRMGGDTAWAHALGGLCHARRGDVVRAIQEYSVALQLAPDHLVARFARGKAQYYLGAYDAALLDVEKVVELMPESPVSVEVYTLRGECHDKLSQFSVAIKDYSEAIRQGGNSMSLGAKLFYAMANAKEQQMREDAAAAKEAKSPDQAEGEKQDRYRGSLHETDDADWLNKWIRERLGGEKSPQAGGRGANGYSFSRLFPH